MANLNRREGLTWEAPSHRRFVEALAQEHTVGARSRTEMAVWASEQRQNRGLVA